MFSLLATDVCVICSPSGARYMILMNLEASARHFVNIFLTMGYTGRVRCLPPRQAVTEFEPSKVEKQRVALCGTSRLRGFRAKHTFTIS